MLTEPTSDHHPENIMQCVLVGLGLEAAEARTIAFMPLPQSGAVQGPISSRLRPIKSTATKARSPARKVASKALG